MNVTIEDNKSRNDSIERPVVTSAVVSNDDGVAARIDLNQYKTSQQSSVLMDGGEHPQKALKIVKLAPRTDEELLDRELAKVISQKKRIKN